MRSVTLDQDMDLAQSYKSFAKTRAKSAGRADADHSGVKAGMDRRPARLFRLPIADLYRHFMHAITFTTDEERRNPVDR